MKIKRELSKKPLILSVATVVVLAGGGVSYALVQQQNTLNDVKRTQVIKESPSPSATPVLEVEETPAPSTSVQPSETTEPSAAPSVVPVDKPTATKTYLKSIGFNDNDAMCFDKISVKRGWYKLSQDAINAKADKLKSTGYQICGLWYTDVSTNPPNYPLPFGL